MERPSDSQGEILRQIVQHAGDLADGLEAQFATCLTAPEDHCDQCFDISVSPDVPLLPQGTECPIGFAADLKGETESCLVLVWHENGQATGVEISWYDDPHPPLTKISILQRCSRT
jgi:hypothetical protein